MILKAETKETLSKGCQSDKVTGRPLGPQLVFSSLCFAFPLPALLAAGGLAHQQVPGTGSPQVAPAPRQPLSELTVPIDLSMACALPVPFGWSDISGSWIFHSSPSQNV